MIKAKERKPYYMPKDKHEALLKRRGGYHATSNKEYDTAALTAELDYEIKEIVDKIKAKQLSQSGG